MPFENVKKTKSTGNPSVKEKLGKYFEGVSNSRYHSDKEFYSSSQLKKAIQSPFNFYHEVINPSVPNLKASGMDNPLDWGSLVHAILLEPETVPNEFAILKTIDDNGDKRDFRKKEHKDYKKAFELANKGKIVLSDNAYKKAVKACNNVKKYIKANELLEAKGKPEMSGYFKDEFSGLHLRFRPDRLVTDYNGKTAIVDVKTTQSISKKDFYKDAVYKYHYDLSAYMYLQGHQFVSGEIIQDFYFLCVENKAPYAVAVYKASPEFLQSGAKKYIRALKNIKEAINIKSGENLNYQSEIEEL